MSEKHRNAQKSMPQSRKLFKYQKRKIRCYLKRVRWRRKRRQRYFLYGLALAVSMYLGEHMEDTGTDLSRSGRWM
ncbi:MAG: hypothetical protein ACLR8P_12855 [Clostridium fessum]